MKALRSFEASGIDCPMTRRHFPRRMESRFGVSLQEGVYCNSVLVSCCTSIPYLLSTFSVYGETKDRDITCAIYRINHTCSLTGKLSASIIQLINEGTSLHCSSHAPRYCNARESTCCSRFPLSAEMKVNLCFESSHRFCAMHRPTWPSLCLQATMQLSSHIALFKILQTITPVTSLRLHPEHFPEQRTNYSAYEILRRHPPYTHANTSTSNRPKFPKLCKTCPRECFSTSCL